MAVRKTPATAPAVPVDVVAESRDMQLFEAEATPIGAFVRNLRAFLAGAHGLEDQAADRLLEAQKFKTPKTAADDERLQVYIRTNNALKKKIEDHWYTIAAALHAMHRKVTGYRGRGTQIADEGSAIAQRLHNAYVLEARRIADEETRRLQRIEEARQQKIRDAELADLEAQALKLELASATLSDREERFVDTLARTASFLRDDVAPQAASLAGFKDPIAQAARLLGLGKIQDALQAKDEAIAIREQAAATKAAPLDVQVERVAPQISRAPGASDRVTKSARVLDAEKLRAACIAGGFNIPYDVLTVDEAKLNSYARSLGKRINEWPGVQYVETPRTV